MSVSVAAVLARMRLFEGFDTAELAVAEKLVFVNRAAAVLIENIARLLCDNLRQTSSRLAQFMPPLG